MKKKLAFILFLIGIIFLGVGLYADYINYASEVHYSCAFILVTESIVIKFCKKDTGFYAGMSFIVVLLILACIFTGELAVVLQVALLVIICIAIFKVKNMVKGK